MPHNELEESQRWISASETSKYAIMNDLTYN